MLITVAGRNTGLPRTIPVGYFELDDGRYLVAASNGGSERDIALGRDTHPLSTFRVSGMNRDTRPDALFLAAVVARSADHHEQVRQLAYTMIGSSTAADRQITNALQVIDGTPNRDIPLLATQPHWPLRALAAIYWPVAAPPRLTLVTSSPTTAIPPFGARLQRLSRPHRQTRPHPRFALARVLA